jgi:thiol-disulfide isomerase/thioredoxin
MKQRILGSLCLALIFIGCVTSHTHYDSRDEGHEGNAKIIKGYIDRKTLETDTAFKWFADNYSHANPDAAAITTFNEKKDNFTILVFGGTWCHDTQNLLPLFYKLIDKSNFPKDKVVLLGVDRNKTTISNWHNKYNVKNVPTFIILQNHKEVGRVVEYGNTGAIDKELAQIVSKIQ